MPVRVGHLAFDDVDVKVAVSGVAVADRLKAILGTDSLHGAQQFGQLGPRHDRILLFVNTVFFHGFAHSAAQLPKGVALGLGLRKKHFEGTRLLGDRCELLGLAQHGFFVGSVHLHQQVGLDARSGWNRHAVDKAQGPVDGVALHEFKAARGDSGLKNARHRGAGYFGRSKRREHRKMMARVRNKAHYDLRNHAQGALTAHHELG